MYDEKISYLFKQIITQGFSRLYVGKYRRKFHLRKIMATKLDVIGCLCEWLNMHPLKWLNW
jgi:hypothetical protein